MIIHVSLHEIQLPYYQPLKLVRTNLNYRVQGTSIPPPFFFQMNVNFMHLLRRMNVMLDFICMGSVDLQGLLERVESKEIQNEKFLSTVGFEPTILRFVA